MCSVCVCMCMHVRVHVNIYVHMQAACQSQSYKHQTDQQPSAVAKPPSPHHVREDKGVGLTAVVGARLPLVNVREAELRNVPEGSILPREHQTRLERRKGRSVHLPPKVVTCYVL